MFSYNSTAPDSSSRSWIRLTLQDHSSASYRLEDEEIDAILSDEGSKYLSAAACAEILGARYATASDKTIGKLSISQSGQSERYYALAKTLRRRATLFASPFAGGVSVSQKDSERSDSDRVQPAFSVDEFDYQATDSEPSTAVF